MACYEPDEQLVVVVFLKSSLQTTTWPGYRGPQFARECRAGAALSIDKRSGQVYRAGR